jgi:predicted MPP superfamily phosphohydrolase
LILETVLNQLPGVGTWSDRQMMDRELAARITAEQTDCGSADVDASRSLTRRRWLIRCLSGSLAGVACLGGYARFVEPHWIEVVRQLMPLQNLPDELVGKTLVQISDLHIGPIVSDDFIRGGLELVSQLEPDIVVITGDFVTWRGARQIGQTVSLLKDLQPGRLATVAITGNHDYGNSPWSDVSIADRIADRMTGLNIRMLRNDSLNVGGLRLIGVDDYWSPDFNLQKALSSGTVNAPTVALCHNPDAAIVEDWGDFHGWILSGHTHGGQVRAPFCSPRILPVRNKEFAAGHFALDARRKLYVNRALGYSRPVRFNVRPEITVFELQRSEVQTCLE